MNQSVTLHEIKGDTKAACELASEAIQRAKQHDKYLEDSAANARSIVDLLRENITMWSEAATAKDEEEPLDKKDC